ncbi:MAG: aldo/keto reductase [Pseudomonadota bacterium]
MSIIDVSASSRRRFLRCAALSATGLAATRAFSPLALAQVPRVPAGGDLLTRTIPGTDVKLPAIGLGTFLTFDVLPGQQRGHLRDVIQGFYEGGARLIDTSPLYGSAETSVGDFLTTLGVTQDVFIANKIWSTGEFLADESHARRSLEQSQSRLWRTPIDLMQCHSLVNAGAILPILQAWKKEGLIRYTGVTVHENEYHGILTPWIERRDVDFVQVNYSIFNRGAEQRVLPAAAEKGVAVLVNMPLEKARLHKIVEGHSVPDFARELGIENWTQYFLKWVISNPAITCCLTGTSSPAHARENVRALRGALPDLRMRERMYRHMQTIPGFGSLASMPWYPGKNYSGVIRRAQDAVRSRM